MANAKATLVLTPDELRIVQTAVHMYAECCDIRAMEKNELPVELAQMKLGAARIDYQKAIRVWKELT